jgi:hypothetical protein
MKTIYLSLLLVGCGSAPPPPTPTYVYGSPPVVQVALDSRVQQMSRNEVIQATIECESNHMRAVPIQSKRMVSGMMSDFIIDVQCMPRYRLYGQ